MNRLTSLSFLALTLFRAASASTILFEGGTIITFNDTTQSLQVLRNASLLVEGDRIVAISESPLNGPANATHVNATDKIISPGFIDTHHHLWQTAFKTVASNTSLADYYQKYGEYGPAEHYFTTEDLYVGQLTGILKLLYEGTTTVLDHAHASWSDDTIDSCVNATFDGGIRAYYANAVHIIPNDYSWEAQLTKMNSLAHESRFTQTYSGSLVSLGLAYDAFYDAPQQNITELWNLTSSANLSVVTMHHLGGPFGDTNSPTLRESLGWLNGSVPIVFAHSSFMDWTDADLLRETNQYISTTPESELHFGHNHPWVHLIQDQAALGVDCHFTYSSSMVQQARLWLQTLRWPNYLQSLEDFQVPRNNPMSVYQAFYMITRSGGLALRRDDIGVIKPGAKADLVIFRTDAPNMIGWNDPIAAVILHSDVGDIQDVLVDGKYLRKAGLLVYSDYEGSRGRLKASAERIQQIWTQEIEWPELTPVLTEGAAPYGEAEEIDVLRANGTGYGRLFLGEDGDV